MSNLKNALAEYLNDVHLSNMKGRFKDINLSFTKSADEPRVGLFWVDMKANKIYGESLSISDAEKNPVQSDKLLDFRIYPQSHYEKWDDVKTQNKKWVDIHRREYDSIPRGRVIYLNDIKPHFYIYLCPKCNIKEIEDQLVQYFNLPNKFYSFDYTDEHYQLTNNK